jgi:hypothetical protein
MANFNRLGKLAINFDNIHRDSRHFALLPI